MTLQVELSNVKIRRKGRENKQPWALKFVGWKSKNDEKRERKDIIWMSYGMILRERNDGIWNSCIGNRDF